MTNLLPMYPGIANSYQTELSAAVTASATTIPLQSVAVTILPDAPNLAVIGTDETAETILYTGKSGNTLTGVTRGYNGTTARAWPSGSKVARMFTAADWDSARQNIETLNAMQSEAATIPAPIKRGLNVINTSQASGAEVKVQGRTLVNLLGSDGNFENDSNGDGVADRWQTAGPGTRNIDYASAKYGRSAQRISSLSGDSHTGRNVRYPTPNLKAGKYLYLVDAITDGVSIARVTVAKLDGNPISNGTVTIMQTTTNKTLYSKVDATSELADASVWIQNTSAVGTVGWVSFDGARLYEVSAAEYAKIDVDPEYTGEKLAEKFPYVDSVQHFQGGAVRKIGKNLLPPFSEWTLNSNAIATEPYELRLNATAGNQYSNIYIPVTPNTIYSISVENPNNQTLKAMFYSDNTYLSSGTITQVGNIAKGTFTTPSNCNRILVETTNTLATVGLVYFKNPQLERGSTTTQFEPRNDDYVNFPTLASNVDRTISDSYDTTTGRTFRRWYTGVVLDGSLPWLFHANNTGNKVVKVTLSTPAGTFRTGIVQKSDGTILSQNTGGTATYSPDNQVFDSGNLLYVSVGTADSGWGDSYNPSVAEIKAYFNGWRMNNGTVGTPYNGTGTKSWTPIVSPAANFVGKVSGSLVENPNTYKTLLMTSLLPPASITTEFATSSYSNIATLNAVTQPTGRSGTGEIAVQLFSINLIEHAIRNHGVSVFGAATTTAERVAWLKAGNIAKLVGNGYVSGSGPAGNKVTFACWSIVNSNWTSAFMSHLLSTISKLSTAPGTVQNYIDANGFVHFLAYADASNGTIASTINTDFIDLEAILNLTTIPTSGYATVSYTPYKLDYVLAQGIDEPFIGDTGAIALQAGGNQLELMEGLVVREKVTPVLFSNTTYLLNNTAYPVSYFKYVPDKVMAVYKNGLIDNKWIISFSSLYRNNVQVYINASDYDTSAEYTVTYQVLDKHLYSSNAIDATITYQSTLGGAVSKNTQDIADLKTQNSIQDWKLLLDEAYALNTRYDLISHIGSRGGSHGVATPIEAGFQSVEDKIKLDGIAPGANNYTHPSTHPPSIIAQDASNRFVTDTEKTTWNAKASTAVATSSTAGLQSASDKSKLDGIAAGATNYTHPANHPPSIIAQDASNRFATDAEKAAWNAKASTAYVDAARPYVTGSYTGFGSTLPRDIALPFTPSAVLVMPTDSGGLSSYNSRWGGLAVGSNNVIYKGSGYTDVMVAIGTNKFTVAYIPGREGGATDYGNQIYNYIAYR